jgi:hypothetical protein
MKKLTFTLMTLLFLLANSSFGQAPQSFNYQFIARDASGQALVNQPLEVKISIIKGALAGIIEYSEMHSKITNAFGQVNLSIGTGEILSGSFGNILWETGDLYLKAEISTDQGQIFQNMGSTKLLSVPYAMYADASGLKNLPALSQDEIDTLNAVAGTVVLNTTTDCLNYFTGTAWMSMCGECSPQPTQADAGESQTVIGTQTYLEANTPGFGEGLWEIISGTGGNVAEPTNPSSLFTGTQPGSYTLQWSITTVCGTSSDETNINFINEPPPPSDDLFFMPYVDCLLWPNFDISNVDSTGICLYTCAFIVDNEFDPGANPCWGGYQTLGMDYYQEKVAALRENGGDIIVSFGGANGVELAYAAADEFEARDAYKTVIDAYSLTGIDFDIEGWLVAEPLSRERRSKAMKLLQDEYPGLKISLTLPTMPSGLTTDGLNTVASALNHNVELDCVNLMAMDYGGSGIDMGDAAISAGNALFGQLKVLYQNAGYNLPDSVIWHKVGITPMIGENDVPGEVFYIDDATDLVEWAVDKKIGRLSMWSANRDKECDNPNDPLYSCSHIPQDMFQFSSIFGAVAVNPCNNKTVHEKK